MDERNKSLGLHWCHSLARKTPCTWEDGRSLSRGCGCKYRGEREVNAPYARLLHICKYGTIRHAFCAGMESVFDEDEMSHASLQQPSDDIEQNLLAQAKKICKHAVVLYQLKDHIIVAR